MRLRVMPTRAPACMGFLLAATLIAAATVAAAKSAPVSATAGGPEAGGPGIAGDIGGGAAAGGKTDWGRSVWITSLVQAPVDEFVRSWREAALLDFAAQDAKASAEDLASAYGKARADLAEARSPVVFGRSFRLDRPVLSAVLRISGLGYFRARVNGADVGNYALAPNFTHFSAEALYLTLDVAGLLRQGDNRIEVTVAHGRLRELPGRYPEFIYRQTPVLRAELSVAHPAGGNTELGTDASWEAGIGPVRQDGFWVGEAYDAKALTGGWRPAEVATDFAPAMRSDDLPPQRIVGELEPVAVTQPQPRVWVYDFGRMTAGKARVRVPAGAEITIRYAEFLQRDLRVALGAMRGAYATYRDNVGVNYGTHGPFLVYPPGTDRADSGMICPKWRGSVPWYLARPGKPNLAEWGYVDRVRTGAEPLDYHASFDYAGYRYVEITGLDRPLPSGAVTALEIHNELPRTGWLKVGDPKLQAVADAAARSILLNAQGTYEGDTGAERGGGIATIAALSYPQAWYAFDNRGLASKALDDSVIATRAAGAPITVTLTQRGIKWAPIYLKGRDPSYLRLEVADAFHFAQTPLDLYRFYGEWTAGAAALDHGAFFFECYLKQGFPLYPDKATGDHVDYTSDLDLIRPPGTEDLRPTDPVFANAAIALWLGHDFLRAARRFGRDDLVQRVEPLLARLRGEIDRRYLDPATGRYGWKTSAHRMGANVAAICAGLVPEANQPAWIAEILEDIRQCNGHLTTGSRLTGSLLSLLARTGHIDEALRLTTRSDYPSPFAMLAATGGTIAETWGVPGLPAGANFLQAEGFGAAANWIYESLVGIAPTLEGAGFKRFRLAPIIAASIPSCSFRFESPQGLIESSWTKSADSLEWSVTVPQGAIAEATLPKPFPAGAATLNGRPIGKTEFELTPGNWKIILKQ